jgi:hypothetical protein
MTSQTDTRLTLALNRAIDRRLDELVRDAGAVAHLLADDKLMRTSQLRNVLTVADDTQSVAVVTNFIRYQMGRSKRDEAWLHGDFGKKLVDALEHPKGVVERLVEKVVKEVTRQVEDATEESVTSLARVSLVRLYLGYLNRWFYYGDKTDQWDDIRNATQEPSTHVR